MGTLNLMEALKAHTPECFTLFVSSSEVYGESFKRGQLLDEDAACAPMNPYAASKLAAEHVVMQYLRQGMPGVVVRPFNHIGPGQSADFVTASFAKQIAWIEAGLQAPVLKVGNLDASRDFLNVHDVCEAYALLLAADSGQLQHRTYNIASGASRQIRSVLQALLAEATVPITVQTDPDRLRPSDIPLAAGTNARSKRPWVGCPLRRWRRPCVISSTTGVASPALSTHHGWRELQGDRGRVAAPRRYASPYTDRIDFTACAGAACWR